MKLKGPIITLAAGLSLAAVLMVVNLVATSKRDAVDQAASSTVGTAPAATAGPSGAPTATPTTAAATNVKPVAEGTQVTYAGKIKGGAATVAIAVKDAKAVAYFCDGRTAEAWMQGTFVAGKLTLTGAKNSSLNATVGNGTAAGNVTAGGRTFEFAVPTVAPPSGVYRAIGAQVVSGWIRLEDGSQTGLATVAGVTVVPGPIDLTTGTATVGTATVTATKLDGSGL